jgi:hypothetical protein
MLKRRGGDMLLKILEDKVAYMPDGEVIQLNDITIIGATTDKGLLPKTVLDRFKIKPYIQPYTLIELARICGDFTVRHDADTIIDPPLGVHIARASRGTPRIVEEMVLAARDMSFALGRPPTPEELLAFVEVEEDGLVREHVHYITAMRRYFARLTKDEKLEYVAGEAAMMQILMENKQGIGNVERFLIERGLIERTRRCRRLTAAGIQRAEALIEQGKGPSDIDPFTPATEEITAMSDPDTTTTVLTESEDNFSVRLLINVTADDPIDAVEQFLEKILTYGLRGYAYTVVDRESEDVAYVEDGLSYSMAEFDAKMAREAEEEAGFEDTSG